MSRAESLTERGFGIYEEFPDRNGTVLVQESSIAGEGAHVGVFHTPDPRLYPNLPENHCCGLHLSVSQASTLISALENFIADAKDEILTEPAESLDEDRRE